MQIQTAWEWAYVKQPHVHAIRFRIIRMHKTFSLRHENSLNMFKLNFSNEAASLILMNLEVFFNFSTIFMQKQFPAPTMNAAPIFPGCKINGVTDGSFPLLQLKLQMWLQIFYSNALCGVIQQRARQKGNELNSWKLHFFCSRLIKHSHTYTQTKRRKSSLQLWSKE